MASSDSLSLPYWLSGVFNTVQRFYDAPSAVTQEAIFVVLEGYLAAVMGGLEAPIALPGGVQVSRPDDWWRQQLREVVARFVVSPCPSGLQNVREITNQYMGQRMKQNSR
ncbi:hypothetical protein [Dechloromonas sp. CZR5]|uniref:hypothetical protein n=1 Tax=Dechloromonas sp. CZR5 TaxID=2608630 RepID=UPI00123D91F6|nr:hypothetical protein [Dechloromonas sp. CZR5]